MGTAWVPQGTLGARCLCQGQACVATHRIRSIPHPCVAIPGMLPIPLWPSGIFPDTVLFGHTGEIPHLLWHYHDEVQRKTQKSVLLWKINWDRPPKADKWPMGPSAPHVRATSLYFQPIPRWGWPVRAYYITGAQQGGFAPPTCTPPEPGGLLPPDPPGGPYVGPKGSPGVSGGRSPRFRGGAGERRSPAGPPAVGPFPMSLPGGMEQNSLHSVTYVSTLHATFGL